MTTPPASLADISVGNPNYSASSMNARAAAMSSPPLQASPSNTTAQPAALPELSSRQAAISSPTRIKSETDPTTKAEGDDEPTYIHHFTNPKPLDTKTLPAPPRRRKRNLLHDLALCNVDTSSSNGAACHTPETAVFDANTSSKEADELQAGLQDDVNTSSKESEALQAGLQGDANTTANVKHYITVFNSTEISHSEQIHAAMDKQQEYYQGLDDMAAKKAADDRENYANEAIIDPTLIQHDPPASLGGIQNFDSFPQRLHALQPQDDERDALLLVSPVNTSVVAY